MIHLSPFTCMPRLLPVAFCRRVSHRYGIPVMTLVLDEMTGEADMTRLEAFVDLIRRKKEMKELYEERILSGD